MLNFIIQLLVFTFSITVLLRIFTSVFSRTIMGVTSLGFGIKYIATKSLSTLFASLGSVWLSMYLTSLIGYPFSDSELELMVVVIGFYNITKYVYGWFMQHALLDAVQMANELNPGSPLHIEFENHSIDARAEIFETIFRTTNFSVIVGMVIGFAIGLHLTI